MAFNMEKGKWTPGNIKHLREDILDESQEEFARRFRLSVHAIRRWEQAKDSPSGPATIILDQIEAAASAAPQLQPA